MHDGQWTCYETSFSDLVCYSVTGGEALLESCPGYSGFQPAETRGVGERDWYLGYLKT